MIASSATKKPEHVIPNEVQRREESPPAQPRSLPTVGRTDLGGRISVMLSGMGAMEELGRRLVD
jgi:hypothetical protein